MSVIEINTCPNQKSGLWTLFLSTHYQPSCIFPKRWQNQTITRQCGGFHCRHPLFPAARRKSVCDRSGFFKKGKVEHPPIFRPKYHTVEIAYPHYSIILHHIQIPIMVGCKPPCFVKIPISLTRLKNLTVEARSHIDQGIVDDQIANNLLCLAEPKLWRKSLPSW